MAKLQDKIKLDKITKKVKNVGGGKKAKVEKVSLEQDAVKEKKSVKKAKNKIKLDVKKAGKTGKETKSSGRSQKIQTVLVGSFLVPVVFIVILGVVSYQKASTTIIDKYKESSLSAISAESMYLDLLCQTVASKATELVMDSDTSSYYSTYYDNADSKALDLFRSAKQNMIHMSGSVSYINSYHIVAEKGTQITSEAKNLPSDAYASLMASQDGGYISNSTNRNIWLGNHTYLDEQFGIEKDEYALVFYQKFMRANAILILDIKMDTIKEALDSTSFGENSYKAIVSQDGREIVLQEVLAEDGTVVSQEVTENIFAGKDFFVNSLGAEKEASAEITIDGEKYLYVYAPVGNTGIMLCSLIPYDVIVAEAVAIRNMTVILVILAALVAMVVGSLIAVRISKTLQVMIQSLNKVAEGDLTVSFKTKRKDEFRLLNDSLNNMLTGVRGLMTDVRGFGTEVNELSGGVAETADTINTSMKDISNAVDEVARGVVTQAEETETSNRKMSEFSEQIVSVCDQAESMGGVADRAIDAVNRGKVIIEDLNEQSETTVRLTKELSQDIENVKVQSDQIENIINAINEIAEQTNLLSLNASIEAARAGEHGRGFAVVADEIRKLADQSMQAVNQIKGIVESIRSTTKQTTDSAQKTEEFIYKQAGSLEETISVFASINSCVDELVDGLHDMAASMRGIGEEKDEVQDSIRNISAVSEESAAATEEVTATLAEQVHSIANLTEKAERLATRVHALEDAMSQFQI